MPTSKTLTNLVINRVESQEVYQNLVDTGRINADELYLVEGEDTNFVKDVQFNGKSVVEDQTANIIDATATSSGLMSAADKTKLDSVENGANNYTLPIASDALLGGIKTNYATSDKNYGVKVDDNGAAYVTVPWIDTDTTYTAGTGIGITNKQINIVNGGVGVDQLSNSAVTTAKIADKAITADKLDDGVIPDIPDSLVDFGVTVTSEELNYMDGVTSNIQAQLNAKSNTSHTHDDRYYTESEIDSMLDKKADVNHSHTFDESLSSTSTNAVQNKIVSSALSGKVPTTRTVNGKALSSNVVLSASDVGADAEGSADMALTEAKTYADEKISALVNSAPETLDTIGELAAAMEDNQDAIVSLESIAASKANASDLSAHTGNATIHITSTERTNWNAAKAHADTAHAPSNAEENQNAFSNIVIGSSTISADTKTDTLTFVAGSNVTLTPNIETDTVTIEAKDTTYSEATASVAGLMSAEDKNKLDGIDELIGMTNEEIDAMF